LRVRDTELGRRLPARRVPVAQQEHFAEQGSSTSETLDGLFDRSFPTGASIES
jgi:hypothetical protein